MNKKKKKGRRSKNKEESHLSHRSGAERTPSGEEERTTSKVPLERHTPEARGGGESFAKKGCGENPPRSLVKGGLALQEKKGLQGGGKGDQFVLVLQRRLQLPHGQKTEEEILSSAGGLAPREGITSCCRSILRGGGGKESGV